MTASPQIYDDIFLDPQLDAKARAEAVAQAFNAGGDMRAAYGTFRDSWQARFDAYTAKSGELLQSTALENALTHFQRNMPADAGMLKQELENLTALIDGNEAATKAHAANQKELGSVFGGLVSAEGNMSGLPDDRKDATRAAFKKLQDTSVIGSIDRVRRKHVTTFSRITFDGRQHLARLLQKAQANDNSAQAAFNAFLGTGLATPAPMTAPATAAFRRKPGGLP